MAENSVGTGPGQTAVTVTPLAAGYRVVVTARRADRLQKLCALLGGDEHAVAVGADLAVAEDRDRLAARIDELDAEVDILVNNAGLGIIDLTEGTGPWTADESLRPSDVETVRRRVLEG